MYTLESIASIIEDKLSVKLKNQNREAHNVRAKSLFYFFCKKLIPKVTYQSMVEYVGNRNHSGAVHLIKDFNSSLKYDKNLRRDYNLVAPYFDDSNIYNYDELEFMVLEWAKDKGILDKATTTGQALKTLEECNELIDAIDKEDTFEIVDALGDILVTIIIQAKMQGVPLLNCLNSAYNVISKRTGKMVEGQFVKDK
ncbi:MazG-like family protein [Flavobacterium sp.]|uniref:MazG-like family protein n=1 Tax=Flavobacterium sp. TaxID=239 RepID=UPI0025F9BD23|nr:MazG-like family protein [Flavobacterium sp.]